MWATTALLAVANVWVWMLVWSGPGRLVISVLDVGQGDAIVVESPNGHVLVVDTGPIANQDDAGRRVVLPFLRSRGIGAVDVMVITHPHDDHDGGAASLLERIGVGRLLVPETASEEPVFQRVMKLAREKGVSITVVRRGMALNLGGGLVADVLNPSDGTVLSPNNESVGLRLRYGATAMVLAGDAEADAESEMAATCDLRADVMKLSHHGSRTSTTPRMLEAVRPRAAVVSVGKRNTFGHPSAEVLERLERARLPLFRTDRDGAVIIESDGTRIGIRRTKRVGE